MRPEDRIALAERVLSRSQADGTEVTIGESYQALTRFTHESVNQNVDEGDFSVRVRAIVDGRSGVAATNVLDEAALDHVVARAAEIAAFAPRESIPPVLAGPARAVTPP